MKPQTHHGAPGDIDPSPCSPSYYATQVHASLARRELCVVGWLAGTKNERALAISSLIRLYRLAPLILGVARPSLAIARYRRRRPCRSQAWPIAGTTFDDDDDNLSVIAAVPTAGISPQKPVQSQAWLRVGGLGQASQSEALEPADAGRFYVPEFGDAPAESILSWREGDARGVCPCKARQAYQFALAARGTYRPYYHSSSSEVLGQGAWLAWLTLCCRKTMRDTRWKQMTSSGNKMSGCVLTSGCCSCHDDV